MERDENALKEFAQVRTITNVAIGKTDLRALRATLFFFLCLLEEHQEHPQDSTLMPMIIERFADFGAVIENLELTKELGETIQKQEQQIDENLVEKQKWEEKGHISDLTIGVRSVRLRQAVLDVDSNLKGQESSYETLKQYNYTLRSKLKQLECNISEHVQENRKLEQQNADQSDMMQRLHQEVNELHEHHESVLNKIKELKKDVTAWQEKYKEKEKQIHEMENAHMMVEKQDENLEFVKAENRKLQEHMDMMAQKHEKHLADHYKS
ncbi:hypothetical protein PsorP6_001912 [Peronosclerospora sorghi]|uniref:Uncharacterized protein n=1 Tax=Peronosclerospora sorghi TaxID=230839 RepID=A0ACC0WRD1_9STRA|nr:hypothetical protein PsorP6_001912 [Peronosclerospora sorghi]